MGQTCEEMAVAGGGVGKKKISSQETNSKVCLGNGVLGKAWPACRQEVRLIRYPLGGDDHNKFAIHRPLSGKVPGDRVE